MNSYLLFDPTISDVSTLLEGLNQNYLPIPIQRQTLFETINNIVSENETFELNILAHGAPGGIYVNGEFVGKNQWVSGISQLSSSAIQNLDINSRTINFWSCETGAGDSGSSFAEVVSITTAAAVNMSENKVGHEDHGAVWSLEQGFPISSPFSQFAMNNWHGVLSHSNMVQKQGVWLRDVTPTSVTNGTAREEAFIGQTNSYGWLWYDKSQLEYAINTNPIIH